MVLETSPVLVSLQDHRSVVQLYRTADDSPPLPLPIYLLGETSIFFMSILRVLCRYFRSRYRVLFVIWLRFEHVFELHHSPLMFFIHLLQSRVDYLVTHAI